MATPQAEPASDPGIAARDLAPMAREAALEAERERRLPAPLVAAISGAGLFRMLVPRELDGGEATPAQLIDAVETLANGDGAAGWCLAVASTSGMLAAYLPEDQAAEVYGDPDGIAGGVFAPKGRAVEGPDGLLASGRWPFASGCEHCDWLMGCSARCVTSTSRPSTCSLVRLRGSSQGGACSANRSTRASCKSIRRRRRCTRASQPRCGRALPPPRRRRRRAA